MGDRTFCTLDVAGVMNANEKEAFLAHLRDNCVEDLPDAASSDLDAFAATEFSEMNYAAMPGELEKLLREARVSFVWEWEPGGGYGAGITIYDATRDAFGEFACVEGEPVLKIEEAEKPENLAEARAWRDQSRAVRSEPLLLAESSHELMDLMAGAALSPFLKAHLVARRAR